MPRPLPQHEPTPPVGRACLSLQLGKSKVVYCLDGREDCIVGRSPQASFQIEDESVSRHHLAISVKPLGVFVEDLSSANGTYLGGLPLEPHEEVPWLPGVPLVIGETVLSLDMCPNLASSSFEADSFRALFPGSEFELLRKLGEGASGTVWAARRSDGETVAIKVLHREVDPGDADYERFLREGRLCARVSDPHVVALHELRISRGRPLIVMEYVPGPTAIERLERGPLDVPRVVEIASDLTRALYAVHAAGIVHRDVKPSNVLLGPTGRAKLADFGIAKSLTCPALTEPGIGLGTMAYIAPEQAQEAHMADLRSDLYSLGATIYHLLTGQPAFRRYRGEGNIVLLRQVLSQAPLPPAVLRPECPPALNELILDLMEKDPADRPADSLEVLARLNRLGRRRAQSTRGRITRPLRRGHGDSGSSPS